MSRQSGEDRRPFRRHIRTLSGSVAFAALVWMSMPQASAENANIKSMTFNVLTPYKENTVNVSSSDGAKWDTIVPGEVKFWADMNVDTRWPGYVQDAGLFLGTCVDTGCGQGSPLIFYENAMERDYHRAQYISFATSKFQISSIIPAPAPYGDEMLRRCNEKLQPDGATKPHSFDMAVAVAFSVNTRKGAGDLGPAEVGGAEDHAWGGGDETRHGVFFAHVECLASSRSTADPTPDPHRNKITAENIELFVATMALPDPSPRGVDCKPVKVTTRITTDKAGPVNVKQWRQVNGGPITSETRQMAATAQGGGSFGDDWVKLEQFTKTTTVQYKAEVLGGTFAPSTQWKSVTVHCNGNYAAPTSDANPDNRTPPRVGTGTADKRRKSEERSREPEFDGRVGVMIGPRPMVGRPVMQPPRPLIGVAQPVPPAAGGGFQRQRPLLR